MDLSTKSAVFRFFKFSLFLKDLIIQSTVNPEVFARILFSQIALKDIFATLKIRDLGMVYLYQ